tara:strand:- start:319167 stop:321047 length:1881 start_codon:yes stop_codon:yes gene_type:complete
MKNIGILFVFSVAFFPLFAHAALTDGLVSFWSLNEASGTRADSIGSNNVSVVGNAISSTTGKTGTAAQFQSGTTGYLSVANNSSFNTGGGDFSLSAWVYLDNRTGTQVFVSKYSASGYALYYEPVDSAFLFSTYASGSDGITKGTALGNPSTGTWYHLTGVHDSVARTNTLRINDQYQNVITAVTNQPDTSGPFTIGAFGSGGAFVANARVDAVGFWNRKLTSGEITQLYASGSGIEVTADITAPTFSNITATSITNTGATITWTTNEAASSRVVYGLVTSANSAVTSETDTPTGVTSHSRSISSLLPCTTYQYAVVSGDTFANYATSTDAFFNTTGCEYDATPTQATSTNVLAGNTGTTNLVEDGKTFAVTVDAPAGTSLVIQVKALPSASVLTTLGRPSSTQNEVGSTVFDVKAIVNANTIYSSFDRAVTVEYAYSDAEISSIDESSLRLYHYTGGAWVGLNGCVVNTVANTISCTTTSFSIFGLFGSPASSSARKSTTTIQGQVANLISIGRIEEANALKKKWHWLFPNAVPTPTTIRSVRDLEIGNSGEDVFALQKFLNANGSTLAVTGAGSPGNETNLFGPLTRAALAKFQLTSAVYPSVGYFGPITRSKIGELGLGGVWW